MNRRIATLVLCAAAGGALGWRVLYAQTQRQFPLAAPAGQDSGAVTKAPAGAVNQGPINEKTWKYGHAWDHPPGTKIWNPVKLKLMRGEKVTGGTMTSADD